MVIKSPHHIYEVMQVLFQDEEKERFICVETTPAGTKKYWMVQYKNPNAAFIGFINNLQKNQYLGDFVECFLDKKMIFIVFRYADGEDLEMLLLQERLTLSERMQIGGNLIRHLILNKVPYCLACDALKKGHVRVGLSLSISYVYSLDEDIISQEFGMQDVENAVLVWMQALYREESCQRFLYRRCFKTFFIGLSKGIWKDYEALYQAYLEVLKALKEASEAEQGFDIEGRKTKIINLFISFYQKYAAVLAVLLILLCIAVSIFYYHAYQRAAMQRNHTYERIGTVWLEGGYE